MAACVWSMHFTSPRFLPKNLFNFLQIKKGGRHFYNAWDEAGRTSDSHSQDIDEIVIKHPSHHIVFDPIEIKSISNEITGEWVMFHKHEGVNYYLTFAFHEEPNDGIYNRVVKAYRLDNFPSRL